MATTTSNRPTKIRSNDEILYENYDNQNNNPNPILTVECVDEKEETIDYIIANSISKITPQSSLSVQQSPGNNLELQTKNNSILIANISPKPRMPISIKKGRVASPRTPQASSTDHTAQQYTPTPKPKMIFEKKRTTPATHENIENCNIAMTDTLLSMTTKSCTPTIAQQSPGRKTYVSKLYRMVSPDRRTDIMPEPFDYMKSCISIINGNGESDFNDEDCDNSIHTNIAATKQFALNEQDLQTLYHQLAFFRMQMSRAMMNNKTADEQDLVKAWQLVYETEDKEADLRVKDRMTADIIAAHNQLKSMESLCDSVMNDAAIPMHLLNSYVGLTDSYEKSTQNAKTVRRINETLASNNEYSTCILELERVVRSLELLAEKQIMVPHTSKVSSIKSPQPEKTTTRTNSTSSQAATTSAKKTAVSKKG